MNNFEDYLFWRLSYYFIKQQGYRMIQLSKNQKELWLEKRENKNAQVIRLLCYDLNWSNWVTRDIERTAQNGEMIRKQMGKKEITVLNLYISAYEPVDDYSNIEKSFIHSTSSKTQVISKIIERRNFTEQLKLLGKIFAKDVSVSFDSYIEETETLKRKALEEATDHVKKERNLFQYGTPFFTYIFMIIQIIIYFLMEKDGGSQNTITLLEYGAKFNPLILEGEWWRFIAPMFLHIGFLHLFMNTLALYYLGTVVERIYGNFRFLFIYFVAGFGGTLASFLFSTSISAGASGAIFGCFGALLYFGFIYPKLFFRTMGINIIIILFINLIFGFTIPGIDNAGHIGGLIGGFLATGIVHFPKKKKLLMQFLFLGATIMISALSLSYGYNNPKNIVDENSVFTMVQYYTLRDEPQQAYDYMTSSHIYEENLSADYLFNLAQVEYSLNKIDNAIAHLLQVVELKPDMDEAHYHLAVMYQDIGNDDKARSHLQIAAELNPDNKLYSEKLNFF